MEFLKAILGEELYSQFESKINEYNGSEANKDKQVKIGNISTGEYVNKSDYRSSLKKPDSNPQLKSHCFPQKLPMWIILHSS